MSSADQTPAETPPGPRRRRVRMWVLAGLAVAVIVALVLPGISVSQAGYYRRYPGLGERMDAWANSTHQKMSCVDCHVEPGLGGAIAFGVKAVPAFFAQILRGPDTTNLLGPPSRAACQKCHTTYRQVAPSGDLLIPHRAHVEVLGLECTVCHKDLVHSLNRRGFNRPEMELCLEQCHDGDKAVNECVKCHTRKHVPATHDQPDWLQTHGVQAQAQDCGECHDWTPDYCAECHQQRPASHVGNWKKAHAAPAKARDDGCRVCHADAFCERCH